jgi:hypothetical protein
MTRFLHILNMSSPPGLRTADHRAEQRRQLLGLAALALRRPQRTRHASQVHGGEKASGAAIASWTADFFIPFALLKPLGDLPPSPWTT